MFGFTMQRLGADLKPEWLAIMVRLTNSATQAIMDALIKELHLKKQALPFTYCGLKFEMVADCLKLTQPGTAAKMEMIQVPRGSLDATPVTEALRSSFRSLIGQLLWLALKTRPDVASSCSILAQRTTTATIGDCRELNKVGRYVLQSKDQGLLLRRNVLSVATACILSFGDSSFANAEGEKSQCGIVVVLVDPKNVEKVVMDGRYDLCRLVVAKSATVKRVVRSTLAAEGYACSEAVETGYYARVLLEEMCGKPGRKTAIVEADSGKRLLETVTDSNSLEDSVKTDAGQPSDKRLRIVMSMLREAFAEKTTNLRWANTHRMLADGLTKLAVGAAQAGSGALLALMSSSAYTIQSGGRIGRTASLAAALAASQVTRAGGMEVVDAGDYSLQLSMMEGATISFNDPSWTMVIVIFLVGIFGTQAFLYAKLLARQAVLSALQKLARLVVYILGGAMPSEVLMIDAAVGLDEPENEPQANRDVERAFPPGALPRLRLCDCCGHQPATVQCRLCDRRVCEVSLCYIPRCEICNDAELERHVTFSMNSVRRPTARDVQTQAQTTYTALRGSGNPRFTLTAPQFGCYTADGTSLWPVIHQESAGPR
jgi:hypothetical protein